MKGKVVSVEIFKKLQQRLKITEDIIKNLPSEEELEKTIKNRLSKYNYTPQELAEFLHKRIGGVRR